MRGASIISVTVLIVGACFMPSISFATEKASEQTPPAPETAAMPVVRPVAVTLLSEHTSVMPGGTTRIGIQFRVDDGWHIYAQEPGDAGLPTTIELSASRHVSFDLLQWPKPQQFMDPGDIHTSGYTDAPLITSRMRVPVGEHANITVVVLAHITWLACKEICVPGRADLELALPISSVTPIMSSQADLFSRAAS